VMSLSSNRDMAEPLKLELEKNGHQVSVLNDRVGKYDNNVTYVQLYQKDLGLETVLVVNRDVVVTLPSRLNSDTLMEALLKIRAAKTFGANQVSVYLPSKFSGITLETESTNELDLEALVATAGADFVSEAGAKRQVHLSRMNRNLVTKNTYWIGGSNHPELAIQVGGLLGLKAMTFEDMKANAQQLHGRKVYWVATTTNPLNEGFFQTLSQVRWLEQQGAAVHLVSPYLPYARGDKPEFDVGMTTQGRLAADLIESSGTQGITVVRAHAPQSLGFFNIHANEISGRPTLVNYLKSQDIECVISPDAGFQKDATKYQQELTQAYGSKRNVCLVVMNKQRNSDGKETILGGTGVENLRGKRVVIIDDETASGGTLGSVAKVLQGYGPKSVFAVVTHLAGDAKKGIESEHIEKLIVTNTIPVTTKNPKLLVISVASEIADFVRQSELNR
ncbi:MAG: ribose-phosphate diphosphokinase, partial [Bdellovibrionia bacterium]